MRRIVHSRVDSWLLLAVAVGSFGCPLLLDDQFSTVTLSESDAGDSCVGIGCVPRPHGFGGGAGADAGAAGVAGSAGRGSGSGGAGSGGTAGTGGSAGSGGASDAGGSAGSGGTADAGGSAGSGGTADAGGQGGSGNEPEACRTLEQSSSTYGSASNCLGVHGTGNVYSDSGTTLQLSYDSGDPCFTGRIASTGWGAVYEMTFEGEGNGPWDATAAGVTGFTFAYRGGEPPSSLRVMYKDPSGVDNCHAIGPGTTSVPFSIAHPGCSSSGSAVDASRMDEMVLVFPVRSPAYDVDFCVQISALD